MTTKSLLIAAACLVIGLVIGFFAGRVLLIRQWSQPLTRLTPEQVNKSSGEGANPAPRAGTRVLGPMPIGRARAALRDLTDRDPVIATVASIGQAGPGEFELHVSLENRSRCTVQHAEGVAYGFDPYGRPAPMNRGGESYVAFTLDEPLGPGEHRVAAEPLKDVERATLALAQVDKTTCADGSSWARP